MTGLELWCMKTKRNVMTRNSFFGLTSPLFRL